MRSTFSRRALIPRVFGGLAALGALGALGTLGAACSDAPRFYVVPGETTGATSGTGVGGGGTGTTGSGGDPTGSGGNAPAADCDSNADCAYPTPVCDRSGGSCVECLEASDCSPKPGTVCSKGACVCPTEGDTYCAAWGNLPARCVDTATSTTDCGSCNHGCFGACGGTQCADPWAPTATVGAPVARTRHVAAWDSAGSRMIVWGGSTPDGVTNTGGLYDPATNSWAPTSIVNAPSPRQNAASAWDDASKTLIVWGGQGPSNAPLNTGGIFDPKTNTWRTITTNGAPAARYSHTLVWTGSKLVVWGGFDGQNYLNDGATYDPVADAWSAALPLSLTARRDHTALWTGATMVVWGGYGTDGAATNVYLNDGATYNPMMDTWTPLLTAGQPGPRARHSAVWTTMSSMLIWGGTDSSGQLASGGKYTVAGWFSTNNPAPEPREGHTAVWMDATKEMIVWGGQQGNVRLNSGYRLNEATLNWSNPMPTAPTARAHHTAVVTGSKMIIWGGDTDAGATNTGAIFDTSQK